MYWNLCLKHARLRLVLQWGNDKAIHFVYLLEDFSYSSNFPKLWKAWLARKRSRKIWGVLWWHLSPFKNKAKWNKTKPRRVKAKRNSLISRKVEATTRQNKLSLCTLRGLSLCGTRSWGGQDRTGQLCGGAPGSALGAGLSDLLPGHTALPTSSLRIRSLLVS